MLGVLEAQRKSASTVAQPKPKGVRVQKNGEEDKGEETDIRKLLVKIPTSAKSKVLRGIEEIFHTADKVVIAYIKQMEEFQTMASNNKAKNFLK